MADRRRSRSRSERDRIKFQFDNSYFHNPQLHESVLLYQIGDVSCAAGFAIGPHKQYCYEISYIVSGKGSFSVNGEVYHVQERDIILNVPEEIHDGEADPLEPFRYFYVGFNFDAEAREGYSMAAIKELFDRVERPVLADRFGIDVPFIRILDELHNLKEYSALMISMYLHQIIVLAYRNFAEQQNRTIKAASYVQVDEQKKIVYEVIQYIDANLLRITELGKVAEELHYSYSYLSHIFKKEVGMTIKEYFDSKRFEQAVEWLKLGGMTITQMADRLHYQSIHTFSKAFRNKFGISPSEYQALLHSSKK
ncbi:AraC family transcriptional regulator [Paenibacillus sp. GCM10027626]|uniref:AraC family transcriptional regulator n=1 Tax=Paenibacillus sp. GCM10027626 TaxID=3273411 RepID=UPI00362546B1